MEEALCVGWIDSIVQRLDEEETRRKRLAEAIALLLQGRRLGMK